MLKSGQMSLFVIAGLAMMLVTGIFLSSRDTVSTVVLKGELIGFDIAQGDSMVLGWQVDEALRVATMDALFILADVPKEKIPLTGLFSFQTSMENYIQSELPRVQIGRPGLALHRSSFPVAQVNFQQGVITTNAHYPVVATRDRSEYRRSVQRATIRYDAERLFRFMDFLVNQSSYVQLYQFEGFDFLVGVQSENSTHNVVRIQDESLIWRQKPFRYSFYSLR